MRRMVVFVSLALLPIGVWAAASTTGTTPAPKPITKLPTPVAEPAEGTYEGPSVPAESGPSAADRGPAQRYFVIASQTDNLENDPHAPIRSDPSEKIELDKKIRVPVVHDVQDDASYKAGNNDSILFEVKYLNWGAVTREQLRARQGHYFTITFVNKGAPSDFVTHFEYRQVLSKAIVRSLEQKKVHVHGATRAYFAVVDKAYLTYGPVSAWRFTVLRGDTVVAEAKSFLW